jgi:hypothetical protein
MAKQPTDDSRLRRHEKIVAAVDLPGVPAGTRGKVLVVNGLTWIRYWARFANGVELGQLNRSELARPGDWDFRNGRARDAQPV